MKSLDILQLEDGQEIKVDDSNILKIYKTPGHTTDHAVLFNHQTSTLYSGDCILGEGTAVFEDLYDYMASLERIIKLKPKIIYPGHGNIIENAVEKVQFYINHRQERERQVLDTLIKSDKPLTAMQIVEVVYTDTPKKLFQAASSNIFHHLTKLLKEAKVKKLTESSETLWQISEKSNKL